MVVLPLEDIGPDDAEPDDIEPDDILPPCIFVFLAFFFIMWPEDIELDFMLSEDMPLDIWSCARAGPAARASVSAAADATVANLVMMEVSLVIGQ